MNSELQRTNTDHPVHPDASEQKYSSRLRTGTDERDPRTAKEHGGDASRPCSADLSGKKVVVIGAGPAGLTAGYKLLLANRRIQVVILEESGTIGGISRTVVHNGNRMDIGGHRFFSKDPEVNAMWQELMPLQGKPSFDDLILGRGVSVAPGGPDPEQTDRVMLRRNRVSRIYYRHHLDEPEYHLQPGTCDNI